MLIALAQLLGSGQQGLRDLNGKAESPRSLKKKKKKKKRKARLDSPQLLKLPGQSWKEMVLWPQEAQLGPFADEPLVCRSSLSGPWECVRQSTSDGNLHEDQKSSPCSDQAKLWHVSHFPQCRDHRTDTENRCPTSVV